MSENTKRPRIKKTYGKQRAENALILSPKNNCILGDLTNLQRNKENILEQFQNGKLSKKRVAPTNMYDGLPVELKREKDALGKASQKPISEFFKPIFVISDENEDSGNRCTKKKKMNSMIPHFDSENKISAITTTEIKRHVKEYEQLYLDFGQKSFNASTCPECHMSYNRGTIDDEALHAKYHQAISYKNEILLQQYPEDNGSRIVMLTFNQSSPFEKRKIRQILDVIDTELCAVKLNEEKLDQCKIYLYVTDKKKVVGCVVAETISQAYRVVEDDKGMVLQIGTSSDGSAIFCCRIWVSRKHRRKGIATKLLNNIRTHFIFGCTLKPEDFAFSQPTGDGKAFASRYTKTSEFLVYAER
ncbi:2947_t:CDS:2 [Acaulospora morrowiae]|uniref:2947_t:CDS:1 n=1 Tax=Acaulospora morrowiae TaxID=94023 RepID=A0A9N9FWR2_9GLOM|nr:2947_t:CDS:2 [Acaulospora morrowiae]